MSNTDAQPIAEATGAAVRPSAVLDLPGGYEYPVEPYAALLAMVAGPADPFLAEERVLALLAQLVAPALPDEPVDPFLAEEVVLSRLHRTLRLDVDGLNWQKTRLSMNDRLHPKNRATRTKVWRELAAKTARTVRGVERARVLVYYRFPNNIRREVNNLMPTSKAIVDGLVDAGVFPDDNDKHVIGPDNRRAPINGPHQVIVRIYVE